MTVGIILPLAKNKFSYIVFFVISIISLAITILFAKESPHVVEKDPFMATGVTNKLKVYIKTMIQGLKDRDFTFVMISRILYNMVIFGGKTRIH